MGRGLGRRAGLFPGSSRRRLGSRRPAPPATRPPPRRPPTPPRPLDQPTFPVGRVPPRGVPTPLRPLDQPPPPVGRVPPRGGGAGVPPRPSRRMLARRGMDFGTRRKSGACTNRHPRQDRRTAPRRVRARGRQGGLAGGGLGNEDGKRRTAGDRAPAVPGMDKAADVISG